MLDHHATLLAMRNRLLTAQSATTGFLSLQAVSDGYVRTVGSFIDNDFAVGMEITPIDFPENPVNVIKKVTATKITVVNAIASAAALGGRVIVVNIPELRGWNNISVDPDQERWRIEEDYIAGPSEQDTTGTFGRMSHRPMYVVSVCGLPNVGQKALYKMADAILGVFPPRLALTLVDGTILRVTSKPGPFRGQVLYDDGDPLIVVTIPLWARTQNTI